MLCRFLADEVAKGTVRARTPQAHARRVVQRAWRILERSCAKAPFSREFQRNPSQDMFPFTLSGCHADFARSSREATGSRSVIVPIRVSGRRRPSDTRIGVFVLDAC